MTTAGGLFSSEWIRITGKLGQKRGSPSPADEWAWARVFGCDAAGRAAVRDAWSSLRSETDTTRISAVYARLWNVRDSLLFAAASDPHGGNTARANLAWLLYGERQYAEFITEMRPVLAFYEETGADRNAAITLRGIGLAEAALGQFAESASDLSQALGVFTRMHLRLDVAMTWNGLGETHQRAGDSQQARAAFTEALRTGAGSGSEFEQARAHHRLGEIAAAAGDRDTAREHWAYALDRYRLLGVPQAAEVETALAGLETHR